MNEVMDFKILNKNEVITYPDKSFGFLAVLGTIIEEIKLVWSENLIERKNIRSEITNEWIDLWNTNLAIISSKVTFNLLGPQKQI